MSSGRVRGMKRTTGITVGTTITAYPALAADGQPTYRRNGMWVIHKGTGNIYYKVTALGAAAPTITTTDFDGVILPGSTTLEPFVFEDIGETIQVWFYAATNQSIEIVEFQRADL